MTVDLTTIIVQLMLATCAFIASLLGYLIQSHMKDKQSAAVLDAALHNALGAMRQSPSPALAKDAVTLADGTPANLATGVQYVIDHATAEAARFRIGPELIEEKLLARIGNAKLDAAPPVTPVRVIPP